MAISKKGTRKIVVDNHVFCWKIMKGGIIVWAKENDDCRVVVSVNCDDKRDVGEGYYVYAGYVVITNKTIREVILQVSVKRMLENKETINIGKIQDIGDFNNIERSYPWWSRYQASSEVFKRD